MSDLDEARQTLMSAIVDGDDPFNICVTHWRSMLTVIVDQHGREAVLRELGMVHTAHADTWAYVTKPEGDA